MTKPKKAARTKKHAVQWQLIVWDASEIEPDQVIISETSKYSTSPASDLQAFLQEMCTGEVESAIEVFTTENDIQPTPTGELPGLDLVLLWEADGVVGAARVIPTVVASYEVSLSSPKNKA